MSSSISNIGGLLGRVVRQMGRLCVGWVGVCPLILRKPMATSAVQEGSRENTDTRVVGLTVPPGVWTEWEIDKRAVVQ